MVDNTKTTLGLPVKTALANTSDRILFIHNAANTGGTGANTASITANNFLKNAGVGIPKSAVVDGAANGDVDVAAINVGDRLDEVLHYVVTAGAFSDIASLTSEFAISANGVINNEGGTDSTGNKLLVRWTKLT